MKFVYGHAVAIKVNDNGRYLTKVIGAESKLEVRLVNRINKLENQQAIFSSINGSKCRWKMDTI